MLWGLRPFQSHPFGTATASGLQTSKTERRPKPWSSVPRLRTSESHGGGSLARPARGMGAPRGGARRGRGRGSYGSTPGKLRTRVNKPRRRLGLLLQAGRRVTSRFPGASRPAGRSPRPSLARRLCPRSRGPARSLPPRAPQARKASRFSPEAPGTSLTPVQLEGRDYAVAAQELLPSFPTCENRRLR